jgi:hypothetical protein
MSDVALRNAAADGAATNLEGRWFSILNTGTEHAAARFQPAYGAAAAGVAELSAALAFTGPASQAVSDLGVYAAATGGTVQFTVPLTGDLAFNAEGDLNLTSAPVTVTDAP